MNKKEKKQEEKRKERGFYLKRDNNATWEEIAKFREDCQKQENRCKICGEIAKLIYDHNHKTGRYRGAICHNCNKMLGFAKDHIYVLNNAIDYLR